MVQLTPGQSGVFGGVMGARGVQTGAQVYASVYSGIPVFEAMIRGISVMRRSSDSWVNATQILKVAGIPKSQRTKILEKEIMVGLHDKVQGGYGKYQGTWIPFQRGQDLAQQYGVTSYLAPIFDFIPSPSNIAALPVARGGTPDTGNQKTPGAAAGYNAMMSSHTPRTAAMGGPQSAGGTGGPGRVYSPLHQSELPPPPPPQFGGPMQNADMIMAGQHQQHQMYQPMYFAPPGMMPGGPQRGPDGLGPPLDVNDSDDEMGDKPPLPSSMRLCTKPTRPKPSPAAGRSRAKLLELFQATEGVNVRAFLGLPPATNGTDGEDADAEAEPVDIGIDIDTVIDEQGHTALHWAASLALTDLVRQLVELGADIHRGNYAGETALMRSVLTTNQAEANTFSELLQSLAPSIRTLDHAYRTVIHHIALVAGIKGRAGSARQYLIGVLGWVAKEQQSAAAASASGSNASESGLGSGAKSGLSMKTLVDVQDVHGDTALNVAARVGNRGLVGLLVEAGADKARANKLGLKPADFGVETDMLQVSAGEAVVATLKSEVNRPERHSRDVQKNIGAIFETVNETFTTEMLAKQTKLNAIEASVRHATRALADKRQQVQRAQAALSVLEQTQQQCQNVQNLLSSVSELDWMGRAPLASEVAGGASSGTGEEIALPNRGEEGALVQLRRMALWEDRVAAVLQDRIDALQGQGADKAVKYRRLVSLCTKVPVDRVDGMLDGLAAAIESDGNSIDLSRISNFMSRMKQEQAV
ncbi:transcription factor [Dioszegia hungarica]|uniref:Transcription factor n=1 Tax=Dioszegia hungarica TaxID=4972 RepID=A0AA38LUB5_9TREE|nr:transcription factor [Dioszegia hungarica]KAI9635520.1 transcription factor [Dioszegia hungarica]